MKHLDQGNHSAAKLIGRLKNYFKTEELVNVKADADLVIFAKEEAEADDPAGTSDELASTSAPAAAAAATAARGRASAGCLQELTRFPAHNFILDEIEYFSRQQVRGMLLCCAPYRVLLCINVVRPALQAAAHPM
jgi:hypothetical protein